MGHEYVEMKNSHAAIEAYRRAVGMVVSFDFFKPAPVLTFFSAQSRRKS
jgi:hypothetical protein